MDSGKELIGKISNIDSSYYSMMKETWEKVKSERVKELEPVTKCIELLMCGSDNNNKIKFNIYDITDSKKLVGNIKSLDFLNDVFSKLNISNGIYKRFLVEDTTDNSTFEIGKMF